MHGIFALRMPAVRDHTGQLHDQPLFWRSAPADGVPTLFIHGVPTSSDDWVPLVVAPKPRLVRQP
mgnify:CR=1 FL=1